MSNKKQTAVEWLVEQIKKDINLRLRGFDIDKALEQAKEMEKQQIIDAHLKDMILVYVEARLEMNTIKKLMSNKKHSAVEWIEAYLKTYTSFNLHKIIEKAKEIEKQQIEDAFKKGQESTYKIS